MDFYLIVECPEGIVRELDASANRWEVACEQSRAENHYRIQ